VDCARALLVVFFQEASASHRSMNSPHDRQSRRDRRQAIRLHVTLRDTDRDALRFGRKCENDYYCWMFDLCPP